MNIKCLRWRLTNKFYIHLNQVIKHTYIITWFIVYLTGCTTAVSICCADKNPSKCTKCDRSYHNDDEHQYETFKTPSVCHIFLFAWCREVFLMPQILILMMLVIIICTIGECIYFLCHCRISSDWTHQLPISSHAISEL